ncbi:LysE family translocator [Salinarimonas rosea]|uniref:LysE family translocator n=1 Tax=Salinarimonas rosea TaxID=552063 RepID=UPI000416B394|nr:LysE family translocator [Salinarimonas rosea]
MDASLWAVFAAAYLAITLSPGPNVLIVLTHAARYGYRSIAVTMAGNLSCQLVIISAVGLGVGALLTKESAAFTWMKYAGAAYLVYLGCRGFYDLYVLHKRRDLDASTAVKPTPAIPSARRRYLEALTVSASNPKTVIFLSAFLPQFVAADRPVPTQFAIMFVTIAAIVIGIHALYAFVLVVLKSRMPKSVTGKVIPTVTSALYIALGVGLGAAR